jgi:hypothetical protein
LASSLAVCGTVTFWRTPPSPPSPPRLSGPRCRLWSIRLFRCGALDGGRPSPILNPPTLFAIALAQADAPKTLDQSSLIDGCHQPIAKETDVINAVLGQLDSKYIPFNRSAGITSTSRSQRLEASRAQATPRALHQRGASAQTPPKYRQSWGLPKPHGVMAASAFASTLASTNGV